MISPNDDPQARESLSALFDGELQGDAARFACKRLAQDVRWRQTCGNWQLAGDVLRGRSMAPAPPGFADGVRLQLAREAEAEAAAAPSAARARRGWVGGAALAASVAVAAWFVANPFEDAAPTTAAPTTTVAAAAPPVTAAPAEPASAPSAPPAIAAAPAPAQPARTARDSGARAAGRNLRPTASPDVALAPVPSAQPEPASVPAATADSSGIDATALADPFRLPPPQNAAARPWPRAVLPGYPSNRAVTAGYGGRPQDRGVETGAADGPTFYPFEPRLTPDPDVTADQAGP